MRLCGCACVRAWVCACVWQQLNAVCPAETLGCHEFPWTWSRLNNCACISDFFMSLKSMLSFYAPLALALPSLDKQLFALNFSYDANKYIWLRTRSTFITLLSSHPLWQGREQEPTVDCERFELKWSRQLQQWLSLTSVKLLANSVDVVVVVVGHFHS